MSIQIEGLEDAIGMLQNLQSGQEKIIRKAVKAGSEIEQTAMTEYAPVKDYSGGVLPDGALKSDMEVHIHKGSTESGYYGVIGPGEYTAWYGELCEYGHRLVTGGRSYLNKKTGKTYGPGVQIGMVPEHPWCRPAFESSAQTIIDTMETTILTEIEKEANKSR